MSWNSNNRAHACLWTFETWHKKIRDAEFNEVGEWKTDYIIGFAPGGSSDMRRQNAQFHVELLDEAFINLFRASYEEGVDRDMAIEGMLAVLSDSSKTMSDLADPVDDFYRFIGEVL